MSNYKHIIWDWNGTLFDDAWLCVDIMNGLLSRRQLPALTLTTYEIVFDFPVVDYYQKLGFDFAVDSFEQLSDEFIGAYHHRTPECGLRPGTRETLAYVQQCGLTQSILSAMMQDSLRDYVRHFELGDFFTDVIGLSNHHAAGKLDVGKAWIADQDLNPAEILFIGDTTHDYEVAAALGVTCVYIHSGHHSRERLSACGVPILDSLDDLRTIIG
jgi:phosphoglycolate phosphatase